MELLERDVGDLRLLLQLAAGTDVEVLILLNEAARQGPAPLERRIPALDQQDFEPLVANREDDDVGRHGQSRHAEFRHDPMFQEIVILMGLAFNTIVLLFLLLQRGNVRVHLP